MKTFVIKEAKSKLQIEEREPPKPGKGEVLIRVRACGVCYGDLKVQQGQFPFARYPVVPGHEIAGEIDAVGEDVEWLKPGDRVGLPFLFSSCGHCKQCLRGDQVLCARAEYTGVTKDGGYQEMMLARAAYVTPLPDALGFVDAAPLMCAGLTVYNGLRCAGFKPGYKVAVIGLGGLGHMGVLYARAMGGRVAVLSTSADKEAEARGLGTEHFINTKDKPAGAALSAWEGGADIILATAPSVETVKAALPGLAPDGTLVVLGAGPGDIAVNPMHLLMGRRRLMGSPSGSPKDLRDALEFAATHGVRPKVTRFPLARAAEALDQMESGSIHGRAALVMD